MAQIRHFRDFFLDASRCFGYNENAVSHTEQLNLTNDRGVFHLRVRTE